MDYLIQFGHTPSLSSREIDSILMAQKKKFKKTKIDRDVVIFSLKKQLDTQKLMDQLGGSVRIAEKIGQKSNFNYCVSFIANQLAKESKPTFSIATLKTRESAKTALIGIKRDLKDKGISARFIESDRPFLNPIQIETQGVQEFIIVKTTKPDVYSIFQTKTVSDFSAWQRRDRERPEADKFSGMLPPKVARMMINLGLNKEPSSDLVVYDPFCGSGTILAEALVMGMKAQGSDISQEAIRQSQANLEWITSFVPDSKWQVTQADAQQVTPLDIKFPQADVIATEVYLGPPQPQKEEIPQIIKELSALYHQSLPNLKQFLKPKAKLVVALPKHNHPESVKMIENLIDTCEKSGYTLSTGPHVYGQKHATVKRAICVFTNT